MNIALAYCAGILVSAAGSSLYEQNYTSSAILFLFGVLYLFVAYWRETNRKNS